MRDFSITSHGTRRCPRCRSRVSSSRRNCPQCNKTFGTSNQRNLRLLLARKRLGIDA